VISEGPFARYRTSRALPLFTIGTITIHRSTCQCSSIDVFAFIDVSFLNTPELPFHQSFAETIFRGRAIDEQ